MDNQKVTIAFNLVGPNDIVHAWNATRDELLKPILTWINAQTGRPCIPDGNNRIVEILEEKLDAAYSPWSNLIPEPNTDGAYEFRVVGDDHTPVRRYAYFEDGRWGEPAGAPDAAATKFALGLFLNCGPAQWRGLAKKPKQPEITKSDIKGLPKLNDPVEPRPYLATFGQLNIGDQFISASFGRPLTKYNGHLAARFVETGEPVLMPVDATRIVMRVSAVEPIKPVNDAERGAWLLKQNGVYFYRTGTSPTWCVRAHGKPYTGATLCDAIDKAMKAHP